VQKPTESSCCLPHQWAVTTLEGAKKKKKRKTVTVFNMKPLVAKRKIKETDRTIIIVTSAEIYMLQELYSKTG
jgi:hypothetical protein